MNLHFLISEHGWQIAGWTMVYFLAIGSLVALMAAPVRWLLRSANPTFRYTMSLAVFAVLALMPVGIALWLSHTPTSELPLTQFAPAPVPQVIDLAITSVEADLPTTQLPAPTALPPNKPAEHRAAWTVARAVEYFPWVWLAGTPLTFLLLATGLIGAERLRRASRIVAEGPVHEAGERLRAALGVGRSVTIAVCDRLVTPLMVGIVRPLILLPPAALTGWSADELEMVLLHELAHVRRWDNPVNLLQRVVESLLFFHPAVWIVSRWVRRDREDCCDAVVVARTAKPQAYAELLVALASPSQPLAGLALARHPLAGRIRRILHLEDETMLVPRNTLVAISTALLAIVLTASCYSPRETEAEESPGRVTTDNTESTEQDGLPAKKPEGQLQLYTAASEISVPHSYARLNTANEREIHQQTQLALIKSHFVLNNAIKDGNLSRLPPIQNAKPNPLGWLSRELKVQYNAEGKMVVQLSGKAENQAQLAQIVRAIKLRYLKEQDYRYTLLSNEARDKLERIHEQLVVKLQKKIDRFQTLSKEVDPSGTLAILESEIAQLQEVEKTMGLKLRSWGMEQLLRGQEERQPRQQAVLLYDGKTFDEWKNLWRTELKTEHRIECVKALAAFGRAGKGREAVEAILNVVEQYDFHLINRSPEGDLQNQVLRLFRSGHGTGLDKNEILSLIVERVEHAPEMYKGLAQRFLEGMAFEKQSRDLLVAIAMKQDHPLHNAAEIAIVHSDPNFRFRITTEIARKALQGDQPNLKVLEELRFYHLDRIPEHLNLFFHRNAEVRFAARAALQPPVANNQSRIPPIVEPLLIILDDPAQAEKHADAIRALNSTSFYFYGNGSQDLRHRVIQRLHQVLREGDEQLLGPTLSALDSIDESIRPWMYAVKPSLEEGPVSDDRKSILQDEAALVKLFSEEKRLEGRAGEEHGGGLGEGGGSF